MMRTYARGVVVAGLGLLCACGGGGPASTTTIPQANPIVNAPAADTRSVELGPHAVSALLPRVSDITGTLLFPAVGTPATISLSASSTAPAGVALDKARRVQSGTLTVYEYVTIVSPLTVSLPSIPAITLHFPASTPLVEKSLNYGISDLDAQGGLVSFTTHGPATIVGQTATFAPVPTPITFEAGHTYSFVVYGTGVSNSKVGAKTIYVVNEGTNPNYPFFDGHVTTYDASGAASALTITGLADPVGIAVDEAGKIYVADDVCLPDGCFSNVSTYEPSGALSAPTIGAAANPLGVAVDAAGKIYVSADDGSVTTYNAAGTAIAPTITAGIANPAGVAVDAAGKIYVVNMGQLNGTTYRNPSVTTYNADGTRTVPTITAGLHGPVGVAVDAAGKIYVSNRDNNTVTTYNADGTQTTPTIGVGLNAPQYLAVDETGKIYVVNYGNDTVTTYDAGGSRTNPTITTGLDRPYGIAVR